MSRWLSGNGAAVCGALLLLGGSAGSSAGQDAPSRAIDGPAPPAPPAVVARDAQGRVTLRAIRLDEPLVLDGRLDEPLYAQVPAASDFVQQEPHEGQPATEKTEVWVSFDRRHVYVSARCWDTHPDRIVATEMRRDHSGIFQNDNFSIVFDTYYDRRNGFLFQTNPLGGLRDGLITDERNNNREWNTVWDVRTARFDQGWTLEMAIPFASLRYREGGDQVWGFNAVRIVRSKNEFSYLTPIPASFGVIGIFKFSSAATLVGIETPSGPRNLEVKPYGIADLTTNRQTTPAVNDEVSADWGFDVKYGLSRNLTLDFTYNTDFAQVEDDEQQINLTRFSLFFPEKRDFFLEGQGTFAFGGPQRGQSGSAVGPPIETPIIFFSRRIGLNRGLEVPIDLGARITGRVGKYSLGLLNIQTEDTPAAQAPSANYSVVRVKRDILRRSDIGIIATHRNPSTSGGPNSVGGLDANFAFGQDLTIGTYYARSWTPESAKAEDSSYRGGLTYAGDRYGLMVEHLFVGERFNPDIGFVRRTGFRRNAAYGRFSPRVPRSEAIRKVGVSASFDEFTRPGGPVESREVQGSTWLDFESGDQVTVDLTSNYELLEQPFEIAPGVVVPVGGYRFQDARATYKLGPQHRVSGSFTAAHGSFYDGERTEAGFSGRVDVTPSVTLEPRISLNRVALPQGSFSAHVLAGRASFTFSPRTAFAALVQYNSSAHSVGANLRFRWEYAPGSDLYVVYTEGRDTTGPGAPDLSSRTFVVKLTRLFRF